MIHPLPAAATGGVVLACRGLGKTYAGSAAPALVELDLEVRAGEVLGLLGPNGAGKTTAISILATLLRPTCGAVHICGVDALCERRAAQRHIGVVPQEVALYPRLTLRENLRYFGRIADLWGRQLARRIDEVVALVGLAEVANRQVDTYSGGMKRRANLAAGLLHQPRLLFLDEPTVGVDAQSRNTILENLRTLRAAGMTMLYTTHYMEEAQQLCSRVEILDRGRSIARGEPQELVNRFGDCANLEEVFLSLTGRALRDA